MIEVCKIPSFVEIVCGKDSALHYVFQYKDLQTSNETHRRQAGNNPEEMALCSACNSNLTAQSALGGTSSCGFKTGLDKFKEK